METLSKRELARIRNWNKARIIGFVLDKRGLSEEERIRFREARAILNDIISSWNEGTKDIGLEVGPRYNVYYNEELWKENVPYSQTVTYRNQPFSDEKVRIERIKI